MNLIKMVCRLIGLDKGLVNSCDEPYFDPLFEEKAEILIEMAKRIEALERRVHSHPLGVGSLAKRRQAE